MDGRQRPRGALDEEVAAVVLPPVLVWDVNTRANSSLIMRVTEDAELDAAARLVVSSATGIMFKTSAADAVAALGALAYTTDGASENATLAASDAE